MHLCLNAAHPSWTLHLLPQPDPPCINPSCHRAPYPPNTPAGLHHHHIPSGDRCSQHNNEFTRSTCPRPRVGSCEGTGWTGPCLDGAHGLRGHTEPRADSVLSITHGSHPCLGAAQGPLCWILPTPPHCRLGPLHSCPVQTTGSLVAFPEAQAPHSPSHGSAKAPIKEPCIISIPLKSLQGS